MRKWLSNRLHTHLLSDLLVRVGTRPLPERVGWGATLGIALLYLLAMQFLTGLLLALQYRPSIQGAYESVYDITYRIPFGWLIRSLHLWGVHLLVAGILIHLLWVFLCGAYKKPREINWMIGVALLFATVTAAQTGHLFPLDASAYTGTHVLIGLIRQFPLYGEELCRIALAGDSIGDATLARFFTVHIALLPALLVVLIIGHVAYVWIQGLSPRSDVGKAETATDLFFPEHARRMVLALLCIFGVHVLLAAVFPRGLGAQGSPLDSPEGAKPEWYFLAFYQLLKYLPHGTEIWVVVLGIFLLTAIPFLDRGPIRDPGRRPWAWILSFLGIGIFLVLTGWAAFSR